MVTQNSKINLRLTSSIRNLLNASIPSLIFEQSRYDYKNFSLQKFPPKYIYDLGRTYTIGLQVSMLLIQFISYLISQPFNLTIYIL